jgi:hypothetical protein
MNAFRLVTLGLIAVCTLAPPPAALAQDDAPPAIDGSTVKLRAILNDDTKPLALVAVKDETTRAQISQVLDVLLEQTTEVTFWRYELPDSGPQGMQASLDHYQAWATDRGLRQVGQYVSRDLDNENGEMTVGGRAALHLSTGEGGGLLAAYAQPGVVNILWAAGEITLGPLLAPLLDLPPLTEALPQEPPAAAPALPELPEGLPMDLLMARLDLTSEDLMPLAREVAARAEDGGEDSDLSADALLLMRKGPSALEGVQGLTVIAFKTPDAESAERVIGAAQEYATLKEWTTLMEMSSGGVEGELLAKLGDDGGILIVGKRKDATALIITQGAPDLTALVAGLS